MRFATKIIFALCGPVLLAFFVSLVHDYLYPFPRRICNERGICFTAWDENIPTSKLVFSFIIVGLILLAVVLPVLICIREIQKDKAGVEQNSIADHQNSGLS